MMSLSSTPSKTPTWRSSMSRWRWDSCDTETSSTNSTRSCSHMSDKQSERGKKQRLKHRRDGEKVTRRGRIWHEKNSLIAGSIWHSAVWERRQSTKWRISFWLRLCLFTVCCTLTCSTLLCWLLSLLLCGNYLCARTCLKAKINSTIHPKRYYVTKCCNNIFNILTFPENSLHKTTKRFI